MTEQVMVVSTADLEPFIKGRTFDVIRDGAEEILDVIEENYSFIDRPLAEQSPQYRQIIPYVLIRHDVSWYLLQRLARQNEARLHNKLSLGIGGHINPDTPDLLDGLLKELEEEVGVEGDYDLTFAGILNDESTEVSRVHLGVVFVLESHTGTVVVRETELMTGRWATVDELHAQRDAMETWTQIVFDQVVQTDND
ncbi:MAG: NUDIX domain-containing protein [Thermoanaerobaculia bacterium]